MIDVKKHFVFHRVDPTNAPDVFVSPHHDSEDALFDFVFQTLGYRILEVQTAVETEVTAKEV